MLLLMNLCPSLQSYREMQNVKVVIFYRERKMYLEVVLIFRARWKIFRPAKFFSPRLKNQDLPSLDSRLFGSICHFINFDEVTE